jgi:pimeloyl-ACP methyl ester carboxylesterase
MRSRREFLAAGGALALAACAGQGPFQPFGQPAPQSGFTEVDGGRLYYEVAGSGPPVVLLHAFTLDTRMWDDQFEVLAREFRVIRYDARGFGRSSLPTPGQPYSPVADLLALTQKLDAHKPHLVGVSMGARFALDLVVSEPDAARSLVFIDGVVGGWPWSKGWLDSYAPIVQAGRRGDVAAAKAAWLAHPLFAPAREKPAVDARLQQMVADYSGWHFTHTDPGRMLSPPTVQQLGRVRVPTLAIIGDRDLPDFQRMAETIERQVANARRLGIAGSGHMSNMEAPEVVNQALRSFLSRA